MRVLTALAMPHARIEFELTPAAVGPHGADQVTLMFTANPGNGRRDETVLNAAFGLGEAVVGGEFLEKLQDCYARYGRDETIVRREIVR